MKAIKIISFFLLMTLFEKGSEAQSIGSFVIENITDEIRPDSAAPTFPGNDKALLNFMLKQLRYPELALENEIEGKVIIQFTITPDSSLTNIRTLRDIGGGVCAKEVIRVLKLMPHWIPAKRKGKPVAADYIICVNFKFEYISRPQNKEKIYIPIPEIRE